MSVGALGWLQSTIRVDVTGEWGKSLHLTVGGALFTVNRSVFKLYEKHPFFGKILDGSMTTDSDGSVVIDRDGVMFRHVLNFIRSEKNAFDANAAASSEEQPPQTVLPVAAGRLLLPDHFDEWDLLLEEINYYQLPTLHQAVMADERYKLREWKKALPNAVYVNWREQQQLNNSSNADNANGGSGGQSQQQQQQPRQNHVSIFPAEVPYLQVAIPSTGTTKAAAGGETSSATNNNSNLGGVLYQGNHLISSVHELTYYMLNAYDMKVSHWNTTTTTTSVASDSSSSPSSVSGSSNSQAQVVEHNIHFVRNTPQTVVNTSAF